MKNSHARAQELISARMDAPLSAEEHRELQNHLATCPSCRAFVSHADELARGLQALPRLAASPAVSRAVMATIAADSSGWGWLRQVLQALSSPAMAVASSLALALALAGALIVALNAPNRGPSVGQGTGAEATVAAVAVAPLPTDVPTEVPTRIAEPTATRAAGRTVAPAAKSPTPRPTVTSVPIVAVTPTAAVEPVVDSPAIQPAQDVPQADPASSAPELAMAGDGSSDGTGQVDLAQQAAPDAAQAPTDEAQVAENAAVDAPAAADNAVADAPAADDSAASDAAPAEDSGRKGGRKGGSSDAPAEVATEPAGPTDPASAINPLSAEAIAALEGNGLAPGVTLPPAPMNPLPPQQSFLPVTPTPEDAGTPTPDSAPETQADAPQLAEDSSGDLGIMALAPDVDAQAPDTTTSETEQVKDKGKRDKSTKDGESHEQQQAAYDAAPMGWSSDGVLDLPQTADDGTAQVEDAAATDAQSEDPAAAGAAGQTGEAMTAEETGDGTTTEPAPQIDPATGMEIDPETGLLIDPTTGYLLDVVNDRVIDPRTHYVVNPMTGLLIDPATGAQLDPVTLQVVIPAGFGSDQPDYDPGSPEMRSDIESVVSDTYDNASIKVVPPTDGPVQPVGDIEVPTEAGDAVEIS